MRHKLRTRLLQLGSTGFTPRVRTLAAWLVAVWLALVAFGGLLAPTLAKSFLSEQLTRVLGREVSIDKISISPLSLSTRIDGLSVKDRAGGEQMGFGQLDVNFSALSIAQAAIVIDGIRLQSPRIAVTHLGDGRFDVSDLLDSWLTDSGKSTSSLPRFSLNNIQISGGQFVLDDGAKVTLRGQAKPFAASHASSLELQLQDLDLSGLQPYMPASVPVHLKAGQLAVALKVDLPRNADASPTIGLSGTAQLSGLALTEASGAPWLALDRLELALDTTDPLRGLWQIGQLGLEGLITGQSKAGAPLKIDQLQVRQARLDLTR